MYGSLLMCGAHPGLFSSLHDAPGGALLEQDLRRLVSEPVSLAGFVHQVSLFGCRILMTEFVFELIFSVREFAGHVVGDFFEESFLLDLELYAVERALLVGPCVSLDGIFPLCSLGESCLHSDVFLRFAGS